MSKICNQCNSKLEDNANFCTFCGSNNIREESVIENQSAQVTSADATVTQPVQQAPIEQPQETIVEPQNINKQTQNNIALENNEAKQDFTTFEFPSSNDQVQIQEQVQQPVQQPVQQQIQQEMPQAPVVPSDFKLQSGLDINQMPDANNPFDESLNAQKINDAANKANKKTLKTIIITIAVTIGILIVLLAIFILFVSVSVDFKQQGPVCNTPTQIGTNQMRIGADGYGYLTIPNTWYKTAETTEGYQYEDGNGWGITLYAARADNMSYTDYANMAEASFQQLNGTIVRTQEKLNGKDAYKISGYFPNQNKYLVAWSFEGDDGNTHYIAIEGPSNVGEQYDYVQSFSLCR